MTRELDVGERNSGKTRSPGRRVMNIPANLAASKIGWSARQSLKSITPRDGFVAPTTMHNGNHMIKTAAPLYVMDISRSTYCGYICCGRTCVTIGFRVDEGETYLTPLNPAATIFWKMSSQRSGTGSRKVWNSPELKQRFLDRLWFDMRTRRTEGRYVGRSRTESSCPIVRHR